MSNIFGTNTTSDLMSVAETAQKIMQGKSLTEDWLEAEMRKVQHKWPRTNPKIKKQWLDKQKARAEKDGMDMSAGGEFEDRLDDYELTIHADDKVWTEASKIKSKWKKMSTAQRTKWLDKIDDLARKQNTSDEDVRAIRDEFGLHMSEEVEVAEAVLIDRDYEYDGKVIKISKKNFSKVHRDFKGTTKGKETMLTYDDKEGTVLVPVEFTEEVQIEEAIDPKSLYKRALDNLADENDETFLSDMSSKAEKSKRIRRIAIERIYRYIFDKVGSSIMSGEWDQFRKTAGKTGAGGKVKPEKQVETMGGANYESEWKKAKTLGAKRLSQSLDRLEYYNTLTDPSDKAKDLRGKAIVNTYYALHRYYGQDKTAWMKFIKASENPRLKEEVAEAKGTAYPATIDTLKMIVKDKQNQIVMFKSGQARVDSFTASAMVAVYDAMKPATKKKFEEMIKDKGGFMKTQAFAMKMTEDVRWNDQIKEDPSLLESLLNEDPDMEEIVKELEGASKMHLAQSKRIQKHLDKMKSEEVEVTESTHGKKGTFTMAPFEDLRGVADVALKIMQRQPQEVKEEEQEVTSEETPQKLTE